MQTSALSARSMSSYPLSIGTSLALESFSMGPNAPYDKDRSIPNTVMMHSYDQFWINLLTLFRNIVSAVPSEAFFHLTYKDVATVLAEEVDLIKEIVQSQGAGNTHPVFYSSAYSGLAKRHPMALLRGDKTERQKQYTALMVDSLNEFYRSQHKSPLFKHFVNDLSSEDKNKTLIMTNYAYDLLSHNQFSSLDLLESHTGVLKNRALWHTKFHNGKDLIRIPFNRGFIQVFGDANTFSPHAKSLRDAILVIAERYQWTYATTKDRILLCINQIPSVADRTMLKDMFSA